MRIFISYSVMHVRHTFIESHQTLYDLLWSNNSTSMGKVPTTCARVNDPDPDNVKTYDDE
jgi:hypothetical protein